MKSFDRFNPMILGIAAIASVVITDLPAYPLMKSLDIGFIQSTSFKSNMPFECRFTYPNEYQNGTPKTKVVFLSANEKSSEINIDFARINLDGVDVDLKPVKRNRYVSKYTRNTLISIAYTKEYQSYSDGGGLYDVKLSITHNGINKILNLKGSCGI